MDNHLEELFLSYTQNNEKMIFNEFKKFILDSKICTKYQIEPIFVRYSINKLLTFYKFEIAIKEIARGKNTSVENLLKKMLKPFEEKEKEKIKEKKKEIVIRQEKINMKNKEEKTKDEPFKDLVKDMCDIGSLMKEEIIEEKKNNPEKFLPIKETLKEKDQSTNFCLGVLAQNLEDIGITTAIEKETNNEEESVKASEMVMQFIMNGMIDKKRFDFHFDFGPKRNNELLNNETEQEIFHSKLKSVLSKEFNTPEEDIIIANPQKGSYVAKAVFLDDIINKMNFSQFEEKCKNSKELEELGYVKQIEQTLIMEGCKLNQNMLDPKGNRKSGWPVGEMRGGKPYYSPQGWMGFGLKVTGKYDNGSDDWLAYNGNENEWAVAYHGVRTKMLSKLEDAVGSIAKGGFKVGKAQAYKGHINKNEPGKQIGVGIYCSPSPKVLEQYANYSKSDTEINGKHYIMGFMMRVKPDKIRYPDAEPDYWILNATTDEMRPYRILVKEKEE